MDPLAWLASWIAEQWSESPVVMAETVEGAGAPPEVIEAFRKLEDE